MNTISRSMIVSAISLIAGLLTMFGITLSPETQTLIVQHLDAVIGGALALYGVVIGILRQITSTPPKGLMGKEPK